MTAGGLVGLNGQNNYPSPSVATSYAAGAIIGTEYAGGLIGSDNYAGVERTVKRAYWDMTMSGITNPSRGAGAPANDHGIKGLSNKKFEFGLPRGFDPKIWKEDAGINGGLPYLINNPPPK